MSPRVWLVFEPCCVCWGFTVLCVGVEEKELSLVTTCNLQVHDFLATFASSRTVALERDRSITRIQVYNLIASSIKFPQGLALTGQ